MATAGQATSADLYAEENISTGKPESFEILRQGQNNATTRDNASQECFEIDGDSDVLTAEIEKPATATVVFRPSQHLATANALALQHFKDRESGAVTLNAVGDDEVRVWVEGIWRTCSMAEFQSLLARKLIHVRCLEWDAAKTVRENMEADIVAMNKGEDADEYAWPATPANVASIARALTLLYRPRDEVLEQANRALTHIVVANGVLPVAADETGARALVDWSPRFPNTWKLPYAYDPEATCPMFDKYLDSITEGRPNDKRFLLQFMGAIVAGKTDQQKGAYLMGVQGSGKSTFANVLECLAGTSNVASADGDTNRFTTASWVGKSLISFADLRYVGNPTHLAQNILKVIGGDKLPTERKGKDRTTSYIQANVVICSNVAIPLHDTSGVAPTRFLGVYFDKRFRDTKDQIKDLDKVLAATEMPGILNRALEGLDDLNRQGRFTVPDSHEKVAAKLKAASSPLAEAFHDTVVEGDLSDVLSPKDIREAVNAWLQRHPTVKVKSSLTLSEIEDWYKQQPSVEVTRPKDDTGKNHTAIQGVRFAEAYKEYRTSDSINAESARNNSARRNKRSKVA